MPFIPERGAASASYNYPGRVALALLKAANGQQRTNVSRYFNKFRRFSAARALFTTRGRAQETLNRANLYVSKEASCDESRRYFAQ